MPAIRRRCCWAISTASTGFPATPTPSAPIAATMASFSIDGPPRRTSMRSTDRSAAMPVWIGATRLLAIVGCTAMLAGCMTDKAAIPEAPRDLRQRHPIAIREGVHTVELLIGSKRGELTLDQRADVIGFARTWRREAAGGILIDLPTGTSNEVAAGGTLQEVRSLLTGMGVPPQDIEVRPYR